MNKVTIKYLCLGTMKILLFSITILPISLPGQTNEKVQVNEVKASNDQTASAAPLTAKIVSIKTNAIETNVGSGKSLIQPDYMIMIRISNPKAFLSQRPDDNSDLLLYANGLPLKGMNSSYFSEMRQDVSKDSNFNWPAELEIPFIFKRDSTNKEAWNSLFRLAGWKKNSINFDLSVGWSGMFPLTYEDYQKSGAKVMVRFYEPRDFWALLILYMVFLINFIIFCRETGLIRDPDTIEHKPGPYSLAQTQLAFWTVIIIGGFGYLILLTGLSDSLNNSVLLLLGISGGTTGIAGFIDYYKKQSSSKVLADATQPEAVIPAKIHRSFLEDILSDGINISVQRTQIVMWNLLLGVYFVYYVIRNKSMPEFNDTLLYLAGVSSILYLSSKGPESPGTQAAPLPPAQQ